jgi:hypothetical protein
MLFLKHLTCIILDTVSLCVLSEAKFREVDLFLSPDTKVATKFDLFKELVLIMICIILKSNVISRK